MSCQIVHFSHIARRIQVEAHLFVKVIVQVGIDADSQTQLWFSLLNLGHPEVGGSVLAKDQVKSVRVDEVVFQNWSKMAAHGTTASNEWHRLIVGKV